MRRLIISLLGQRKASTVGEAIAGLFKTRVKYVMQCALMNWTSGGWQMVGQLTPSQCHRVGTAELAALQGSLHALVKNPFYLLAL